MTGAASLGLPWLSNDLILCADGSWLAYRAECYKRDPKVRDIFIAKASDGKWYYSDYHFCIDMVVLDPDGQPESLERFRSQYRLREFDGRSDDALRSTRDLEEQANKSEHRTPDPP